VVVRPTSAVRKYESHDQNAISAGREQNVDAVLEGNVQRPDSIQFALTPGI